MKLRQSKKLTAALLAAAMAATMLPTVAFADEQMTDITKTGLNLEELAAANTPETTYQAGSGTVTYIPATDTEPTTLILNNATIQGSGKTVDDKGTTMYDPAINIDSYKDTNIKLIGENHIEGCYAAVVSREVGKGTLTISGTVDEAGNQSGSLIAEKCQFLTAGTGDIILDGAHVEYINGHGDYQIGIFDLASVTLKNKTYFKFDGAVGIQQSKITIDDSKLDINATSCGIFQDGKLITDSTNEAVSINNSTVNINMNTDTIAVVGMSVKNVPMTIQNSEVNISNVSVGINNPWAAPSKDSMMKISGNSKLNVKSSSDGIRAGSGVIFADTSETVIQGGNQALRNTVVASIRDNAKVEFSGEKEVSNPGIQADLSQYTGDAVVLTNTEPTAEGAVEGAADTALDTVKYFRVYPRYAVSVPAQTDNGKVTASAEKAAAGETVTLTAQPDEGYALASLTAKDKDGKEIDLTKQEDGTYTFAMPNSNVTVEASFDKIPYDITIAQVEGGTITSEPAKTAGINDSVKLAVKLNEGYTLDYFTVDGEKLDGDTFVMPAKQVTVSAVLNKQEAPEDKWDNGYTSCDEGEDCPLNKFDDVKVNDWYHEGVHFCLDNNLMQGTDVGFEPNAITSRAMITTMLWRLEGEPTVSYNMTFKDVADGRWYTEAIRWAQSIGVVTGYDADTFGTDDGMTREQVITVLYRYAKYKGYDVSTSADLSKFADSANVSDYAKAPAAWAVGTGLIIGDKLDNGSIVLDPTGGSTRAQAATMLMRYCTNILK